MSRATQGRSIAFLFDLGSTFTKGTAVELGSGTIVSQHRVPSTVDTDVRIGLEEVFNFLSEASFVEAPTFSLACSSAAGGLNIVANGLVPELTGEAARLCAFGAGARVSASFGYKLTSADVEAIVNHSPDIVLMAGGTDGGDEEVALHNARALAGSAPMTIVYAGNRVVANEVERILTSFGHLVVITENVLPSIDSMNTLPAQSVIRELFLERIIQAKGLHRARDLVDDLIMPTPAAVLEAAKVLHDRESGDLMIVDLGGATTDVISAAEGVPTEPGLLAAGLKEPFLKRTVEGDLGLRHNARLIAEATGLRRLAELARTDEPRVANHLNRLELDASYLPPNEQERAIDAALAIGAVDIATKRHAGRKEMTPFSGQKDLHRVYGKDLRHVQSLIGTGGIFGSGWASQILSSAMFDPNVPESLRPTSPHLLVDASYTLYAVGLLATIDVKTAQATAKKSLVKVPGANHLL